MEANKKVGLGLKRIYGAGWRRGAPTPKQVDYLVMNGLSLDYGAEENWPINAKQAQQLIFNHYNKVRG